MSVKKTRPAFDLDAALNSIGTASLPDLSGIDRMLRDPLPNPLEAREASESETIEEGTNAEVDIMRQRFATVDAEREKQQMEVAESNDSEFWFAMYFQSREQKEAFLKAMDWFTHGDKYLDGAQIARKHGIPMPPRIVPYRMGKIDKKLADLV